VKQVFFLFILSIHQVLAAQDSTVIRKWQFSGYAEGYLSWDVARPVNGRRPDFLYNFNRHGRPTLNLGLVRASYGGEWVRGNAALAAGSYMQSNYAAEPGLYRHVLEANVGVRLSENRRWWLDVGIFPSHIGFESAIGKDNWNLTRSLLAENSPYFESGARVSYTSNSGKWIIAGLVLNGWQRIRIRRTHLKPSMGMQIQYKLSDKATFNYSNFLGSDEPDTARLHRLFHNVYSVVTLSDRIAMTIGFDLGMQQRWVGHRSVATWYSPVAILRYKASEKLAIAIRMEQYRDRHSVIIPSVQPEGFRTGGLSVNADYEVMKGWLLRMEGRWLISQDPIYEGSKQNKALTLSSAITL
jgi:hypothetical protein